MERAIFGRGGGQGVLDRLVVQRGLPQVNRTDNDKDSCGKAIVVWSHERRIALRPIEPSKPNQYAYVESFNGRPRDECLNENWFPTLLHVRISIESWRRDYNEKGPNDHSAG